MLIKCPHMTGRFDDEAVASQEIPFDTNSSGNALNIPVYGKVSNRGK